MCGRYRSHWQISFHSNNYVTNLVSKIVPEDFKQKLVFPLNSNPQSCSQRQSLLILSGISSDSWTLKSGLIAKPITLIYYPPCRQVRHITTPSWNRCNNTYKAKYEHTPWALSSRLFMSNPSIFQVMKENTLPSSCWTLLSSDVLVLELMESFVSSLVRSILARKEWNITLQII